MIDTFQELLEDMAREGLCSLPYAYERRPYGALTVALQHRDGNPLRLGALLMQEVITGRGRAMLDADELTDILETAQFEAGANELVIHWPEIRYAQP